MVSCGHEAVETFRVCRHLLDDEDLDHLVRFTGHGVDCEYVCRPCIESPAEIVDACAECQERATSSWQGIAGVPQIAEEPSTITAAHRRISFSWPAFVDLQPVLGADRDRWIGVTQDATLHDVDLDAGTTRVIVNAGLDIARPMLRLSRDGKLAAVVDRTGVRGAVIDLEAKATLLTLSRDGYRNEHCVFPIAFFEHEARTLIVHSPAWNRVDIVDPRTGTVISERPIERERAIDYFHCGLTVSRDQRYLADNGWVWGPMGLVTTWSLDAWLANPWESDHGPSHKRLCGRDYYWDGPAVWLDGSQIAVYGYGRDDEWLIAGVRIFDAATGAELRWFPGPQGDLVFDRELFAIDAVQGTSVWNVERGTRLFTEPTMQKARYHPSAKTFVSLADGTVSVLRGADARWNRGRVSALAERIAREGAFDDLPVLGDALEAEGCDDAELLAHCHAREPHADRCWVIDKITAADR